MCRKMALMVFVLSLVLSGAGGIEEANAGGRWRLFRSAPTLKKRSVSTRRVVNVRARQQSSQRKATSSNKYLNSQNRWPGAIGAPDPRYQFFQDINGYWK